MGIAEGAVGGASAGGIIGGPIGAGIGAVVGGGLGALGQGQTNAQNVALYEDSRNTNIAEAQKQRDWEAQMSNSAYQRATDDMRKAGINPMLAYMKGGASTPGGAAASAGTPPRLESALAKGVTGAVDALRLRNEFKDIEASTNNKDEDTKLKGAARTNTEADTDVKKVEKVVKQHQAVTQANNAITAANQAEMTGMEKAVRKAGMAGALDEASRRNTRNKLEADYAVPQYIVDKVSQIMGIAVDATTAGRLWGMLKGSRGKGPKGGGSFEEGFLHGRGSQGGAIDYNAE
nr:MAG: DNA pilot protein [Microvirus sp.]